MTLIAGSALDPNSFFSAGEPGPRGSSFDLKIGRIFDSKGAEWNEPFILKPSHMVQVISAEVFNLPLNITGLVSYKTALTKKGIWALTVGIVDPGWKGPVTTTLLNFSKTDYVIAPGAIFLRVMLFNHERVSVEASKYPQIEKYVADAREDAVTRFPETFLDQNRLANQAGDAVLKKIRDQGIAWVGLIIVLFTLNQWVFDIHGRESDHPPQNQTTTLNLRIDELESRLDRIQMGILRTIPTTKK